MLASVMPSLTANMAKGGADHKLSPTAATSFSQSWVRYGLCQGRAPKLVMSIADYFSHGGFLDF
jgi:hypothetical protein